MSLRIIGIDLGVSSQHKAAILDPASNRSLAKQITFRSLPAEMDRLLARAKVGAEENVQVVAVIEATGMAWYPVGFYLKRQGVQVYRVNGRQTQRLRQVYSPHARSDRIDGDILSRLYLVDPESLVEWVAPSGDQLSLQRLCREFGRLRKQDVAIQNRLHSYDQWAWGGLRRLIPAEACTWMRCNWYDPWRVVAAGVSHLEQEWAQSNPDAADETEWIPSWVRRAEAMIQLYGTPEMVGYANLQSLIQREIARQAELCTLRKRLSSRFIQPLYVKLYPDSPLESLPGVGRDSAAIYMAFIQNIERFPSLAAFRKWCGIVPRSNQSGQSQSKGLGITQAGPNLIKATLYQNANVARLWDLQLACVYHTQMVRYGKHHTQAVCACASHLAGRIYALLSQNRPYVLRDLEGEPISKQQSRQQILEHFQVSQEVRIRTRKGTRMTHS